MNKIIVRKSTLITILYSFFSRARVNIIGQLFGSEIVAIFFFPFSKMRGILNAKPLLKKIGLAYLLLLLSLVFSDIIINDTTSYNYLRGWANIFFSFFSIVFLVYYLGENNKNIYYYLLFAAISFFVFNKGVDDPFYSASDRTDGFKQYYMLGVNLSILFLALVLSKRSKKIPILVFFVYSIACFILDARSNGGIYFMSALILSIKAFNIRLTKVRILTFGVALLFIVSTSYVVYINSILNGVLTGNNSQQIKNIDNPYNPLLLLKLGRTEFFVASEAIFDNPIGGYGSWAEDKTGKYARLQVAIRDSNYTPQNNLIPSHSILLTAWLWAGIGGLIGILLIYIIVVKKIWYVLKNSESGIIVILIPLFFELIWNFLFSPFGHLRETVPIIFALTIVEYYKMTRNNTIKIE